MEKISREGYISCIRFVAMIFIIACHILQGLSLEAAVWINVGVQIFFILSGYCYGGKKIDNAKEWYKKQLRKIVVPYVILCIIFMAVLYLYENMGLSQYNKFYLFGKLIGFQAWIGTIPYLTHTWFVSYIILCYLITPFLQNIKAKKIGSILIDVLIFTLFCQLAASYGIINIDASYIMLYLFGYFFRKAEDSKKEENKLTIFFCVLMIITLPIRILVQYYNNLTILKVLDYVHVIPAIFISYHHALLGIVLFLIMIKLFRRIRYNKFLEISDKLSYFVYLTHQIFILFAFSLLDITDNLFINIVLILFAIMVSSVGLYYISKFVNFIINKIINLMNYYIFSREKGYQ